MKRPLSDKRPFGPFIEPEDDEYGARSDNLEEVEDRLYGISTRDESKVILEMFGIPNENMAITCKQQAEQQFENISITEDTSLEIEFLRKRVDYEKIDQYRAYCEYVVASYYSDNDVTVFDIERRLRNDNGSQLIDDIGTTGIFEAMTKFESYMKPVYDVVLSQNDIPRPSIVFELTYDVPRGASLKDVEKHIMEQVDDDMVGLIGEIDIIEDRNALMVVPLRTAVEVKDFSPIDFNIGGISQNIAENVLNKEINREPELERMVATCTMVGR